MGCSYLGSETKIKSNISANSIIYCDKAEQKKMEDPEDKSFQDFLKSFNAKIITNCSNISSSCLSFSDGDAEEHCKKVNKNN